MSNSVTISKVIRRVSTFALLLAVIIQLTSVVLIETEFEKFEIEEIHEICGFVIFGLLLVHVFLFRKSLKNIIFRQA